MWWNVRTAIELKHATDNHESYPEYWDNK